MSRTPIFPLPEPNHYSDYGFDPQLDYFQILEEARRHSKRSETPKPIDSLHFKLQKPISKEESKAMKRRRWWKSALDLFWKRPKIMSSADDGRHHRSHYWVDPNSSKIAGAVQNRPYRSRAMSGPIYSAESGISRAGCDWGASTPCRTSMLPSTSGPLLEDEVGPAAAMAYVSLRDLSLIEGHRFSSAAAAPHPMPIYLVT